MFVEYELVLVPYVGERSEVLKTWADPPLPHEIDRELERKGIDRDRCIIRYTSVIRYSIDDYLYGA